VAVDKSLKIKGQLLRRRNVLTRGERLRLLEREERWEPGQSVFGLPKVSTRVRKVHGKKKKAEPTEAVTAESAAGEEVPGETPTGQPTEESPASRSGRGRPT